MSRPTASPDLIASHYTRVTGTGEATNRASTATGMRPDAPTQPMETNMFRIFATAAVLALTVTAAQAEDTVTVHFGDLDLAKAKDAQLLTARIHDAAETVCSPEAAPHMRPISHYSAIFEACVYRTSNSAMTKYQTLAKATAAARTKLADK
jgi:UrcA family protein